MATENSRRPADPVTVLSLLDPGCRRTELVGTDFAALACLSSTAPVAEGLVTTALLADWYVKDALPTEVPAYFLERPVTVRGWWIGERRPDQPIGPVFNNIGASALDDAVLELLAIAESLGAAEEDRIAIGCQRFTPGEATTLVTVRPETDQGTLLLRACRGIAERIDEPLYFDEFSVRTTDWTLVNQRLTYKLTATEPAMVGTETLEIPPRQRGVPALTGQRAVEVARLAGNVSRLLAGHRDVLRGNEEIELDFAVSTTGMPLRACRPVSADD